MKTKFVLTEEVRDLNVNFKNINFWMCPRTNCSRECAFDCSLLRFEESSDLRSARSLESKNPIPKYKCALHQWQALLLMYAGFGCSFILSSFTTFVIIKPSFIGKSSDIDASASP